MATLVTLRNYVICSIAGFISVILYSSYKYEDFYLVIQYLSTAKFPVAVMYNFVFMCFLFTGWIILSSFVGELRDLEVEQLMDNGRGFLMDTILFLVLSNPTVDGQDVSTVILMKFICFVVALKTFHLVTQIRVVHMFEVSVPRTSVLLRLSCLMFILLFLDFCAVLYFFRRSTRSSTLYLWLLFECLGMMVSCSISLCKYAIHMIDIRIENGWNSKAAAVFYLDLFNDVLSLGIFLMFILIFFLNHPSRLPLYMTADIIQVVRTLYQRIKSFQRYRKLTRNMEQAFPDATLAELEDADTCIICRDILFEGSKKLPCSHIFHIDCLKSWLVQKQSCPTCRAEIIAESPNVPSSVLQTEGEDEVISSGEITVQSPNKDDFTLNYNENNLSTSQTEEWDSKDEKEIDMHEQFNRKVKGNLSYKHIHGNKSLFENVGNQNSVEGIDNSCLNARRSHSRKEWKKQKAEELELKMNSLLQNMQYAYFMCEMSYNKLTHWVSELNKINSNFGKEVFPLNANEVSTVSDFPSSSPSIMNDVSSYMSNPLFRSLFSSSMLFPPPLPPLIPTYPIRESDVNSSALHNSISSTIDKFSVHNQNLHLFTSTCTTGVNASASVCSFSPSISSPVYGIPSESTTNTFEVIPGIISSSTKPLSNEQQELLCIRREQAKKWEKSKKQ